MDRFEDVKLRVKEASDLVALIESYLPLRPRGRTMVALCPFHQEKSPSFTVYPERQYYHCYGCGKYGDVFNFLMERDGLSFREAMERLAETAGISLDGVFGRVERDRPKGPDPYAVLAEVRAFLQTGLQSSEGRLCRDYLAERGLVDAVLPWSLGYHPAGRGALSAFAQRHKLPRAVLEQAGLLRSSGREPFAGRLVFPIEDERGRTVGFGGRILPGGPGSDGDGEFKPAKYINSPESPFFNKRKLLFGLRAAKQAGTRRLVVVEGYTDVIACHLAGFTGAVAALGTAFTRDHAHMIERYASDGLVLLFDGDRAGRTAIERALGELIDTRLSLSVALIEGAKDPGEVLVERPDEDPALLEARRIGFGELLDSARDALSVYFRLLRQRLDLSQPAELEEAARLCANLAALVTEPVRRDGLVQQMAAHLGLPPQGLQRLLQGRLEQQQRAAARPTEDAPAVAPTAPAPKARNAADLAEQDLLACVLRLPPLGAQIGAAPLQFAPAAELLALCCDGLAAGRATHAELVRYLFARCSERPDLQQLLITADRRADRIDKPEVFFAELQGGRRRLQGQQQVRQLRQQLQQAQAAGDQDTADNLMRQLVEQLRQEHHPPP